MNITFNDEFATNGKYAIKSINTKNIVAICVSGTSGTFKPILALLEEFQECNSEWAQSHILNLTVNMNKLNPMRARCHIELSREIVAEEDDNQREIHDQCVFCMVNGRRSVPD